MWRCISLIKLLMYMANVLRTIYLINIHDKRNDASVYFTNYKSLVVFAFNLMITSKLLFYSNIRDMCAKFQKFNPDFRDRHLILIGCF